MSEGHIGRGVLCERCLLRLCPSNPTSREKELVSLDSSLIPLNLFQGLAEYMSGPGSVCVCVCVHTSESLI